MLNYEKLMSLNPYKYGTMMNELDQQIDFYEHPIHGDESDVIAVCHELKLADYTGFFELGDMTAKHGEYQPKFVNGVLVIGG